MELAIFVGEYCVEVADGNSSYLVEGSGGNNCNYNGVGWWKYA